MLLKSGHMWENETDFTLKAWILVAKAKVESPQWERYDNEFY